MHFEKVKEYASTLYLLLYLKVALHNSEQLALHRSSYYLKD